MVRLRRFNNVPDLLAFQSDSNMVPTLIPNGSSTKTTTKKLCPHDGAVRRVTHRQVVRGRVKYLTP